jgi:hypothetical protein
METQIIAVFCLCADMLKSLHHYEDRQCQMSDAEVMTTAIIAMLYFRGNFRLASQYLCEHRYIPNMLSRSRFNRRLHRIADLFLTLFLRLGETWKHLNEKSVYVIDSYPIAVCDNYRIKRSKIYHGDDFRGYIASKNGIFMVCVSTSWSPSMANRWNSSWNLELSVTPAHSSYIISICQKARSSPVTKPTMITPLKMSCGKQASSLSRCAKRTHSVPCLPI